MHPSTMAPAVILDPGHGGSQSYGGSSPHGVEVDHGLAEKHVNLELAQRVAARLGSLAQLTRVGDVNVPLRERAALAARSGARVLVSLHANSGAYGTHGSEVWLHDAHDHRSAELARALHESLQRVGPTRGVFQGPLAVLDPRDTSGVAACLIEADYLSDPQGRSRLTSSRGLDELADAISSGVRSYMASDARLGGSATVLSITPLEAAVQQVPLAKRWVQASLGHLRTLRQATVASGYPRDNRSSIANVHFHLDSAANDATRIQLMDKAIRAFELMANVLDKHATHFVDAPGTNQQYADTFAGGLHTGAKISFRPGFLDCGPYCRTAMIIHECAHFVGGVDGSGDEIGHYAREAPYPNGQAENGPHDYANLPPDKTVLNAYTYAAFASHAATGNDDRFGLGKKST